MRAFPPPPRPCTVDTHQGLVMVWVVTAGSGRRRWHLAGGDQRRCSTSTHTGRPRSPQWRMIWSKMSTVSRQRNWKCSKTTRTARKVSFSLTMIIYKWGTVINITVTAPFSKWGNWGSATHTALSDTAKKWEKPDLDPGGRKQSSCA